MSLVITGAAGFIGSNLLHNLIDIYDSEIVVIDYLTDASDVGNVPEFVNLYPVDIADRYTVDEIFHKHRPEYVFHLAAESHVDNSIEDCIPFVETNVIGTINLMNAALENDVKKFMHISTDEVYGALREYDPSFTENTPYDPQNPYSASKASSDHFVKAYVNTHNLPAVITNCSNNFGPRQSSEKFIPKAITNLLRGQKVTVYGEGREIRDWLYVQDHCEALIEVWKKGGIGENYNIGGGTELNNLAVVSKILTYMKKDYSDIEFVKNRPGHDFRYSIDCQKIEKDLGWKSRFDFDRALIETIEWYENR
jgi:dTDP-glucose 4,6-dehydratase